MVAPVAHERAQKQGELAMTAHLFIMYPAPRDPKQFDRAYREQHLPYAGPRLTGATSVVSKRVASPDGTAFYAISDVSFPSLEALQLRRLAERQGVARARGLHLHRRRAGGPGGDRRSRGLGEARGPAAGPHRLHPAAVRAKAVRPRSPCARGAACARALG